MQPITHYAKSGEVHVAYQVFGEGPDLVMAPGFVSHIENYWDDPRFARWLRKLGSFCRVVLFDKRGTGLSDRVSNLPAMDERMDDVRAVMDAVKIERAAQFGISEGGPLAALFAATHPERTQSLTLYGAFARFLQWIPDDEGFDALTSYIDEHWGSGHEPAKLRSDEGQRCRDPAVVGQVRTAWRQSISGNRADAHES
jgi:pimeloyl-ACP methyl ester carboxylesterase